MWKRFLWLWETRVVDHSQAYAPNVRREWRRRPRSRVLREGDKVSLDTKGPFGAMVSVCPCCHRIDKIFFP